MQKEPLENNIWNDPPAPPPPPPLTIPSYTPVYWWAAGVVVRWVLGGGGCEELLLSAFSTRLGMVTDLDPGSDRSCRAVIRTPLDLWVPHPDDYPHDPYFYWYQYSWKSLPLDLQNVGTLQHRQWSREVKIRRTVMTLGIGSKGVLIMGGNAPKMLYRQKKKCSGSSEYNVILFLLVQRGVIPVDV